MTNEQLDQHLGRKLVRLDYNFSVSPAVAVIIESGQDEHELAKSLTEKIEVALQELTLFHEFSCKRSETFGCVSVLSSAVIVPHAERTAAALKSWDDLANALAPGFERQRSELAAKHASDPNNGTLGWWRVEGLRHSALVRASSAAEAISKASCAVDPSWESPGAEFIGTELPDVVSC